jgi:Holliday junction resolvase|tara:strand:- start:892 stop:1227 length:336 start_codon:yes stop_codon:yes gene_type:complete
MGKMQRRKGYEFERQITNWFRENGVWAERVPLSGGTSYAKGDVDIYLAGMEADPTVAELKVRKKGFTNLYEWLEEEGVEILIIKQDRHTPLVVMPIEYFIENWREEDETLD